MNKINIASSLIITSLYTVGLIAFIFIPPVHNLPLENKSIPVENNSVEYFSDSPVNSESITSTSGGLSSISGKDNLFNRDPFIKTDSWLSFVMDPLSFDSLGKPSDASSYNLKSDLRLLLKSTSLPYGFLNGSYYSISKDKTNLLFLLEDTVNFENNLQQSSLNKSTNRELKYLNVSYKISDSVEGIFISRSQEKLNDRNTERNFALAGVALKPNKFFDTKILAGKDEFSLTNRNVYSTNNNTSNSSFSNPDLVEVRAAITPFENLRVETSIVQKEKTRNVVKPEEARFGMLLDFHYIAFNVNYSYFDDSYDKKTRKNFFDSGNDKTSIGVTFLLDKGGRYTLYLGNDYYNLLAQQYLSSSKEPTRGETNRSFTASFRGKTGISNSIFFLNVSNQIYSNYILNSNQFSNNNQGGATNLEYRTSLGLEYYF